MRALQTKGADNYEIIAADEVIYPESDGKPMSDNTKQYRWIVKIKEGLESMFADAEVFVAADLSWYPVERDIYTKKAPDVMAAFGRPKGDRGSYVQYKEENIPPQVVFEILSPGNTAEEMENKFDFYEEHGVEEYYVYDPEKVTLKGWVRLGKRLRPVENIIGWVSPRMRIRFEIPGDELVIFRPDGRRFLTPLETEQQWHSERRRAEQAENQLLLERERTEKGELIGEIRAVQRILKRPKSSREELFQKTVEVLKEMLGKLEA
ncbi:MAG: Uma2 family endonuclease [Desulfobacteraceae bacterium]|nr:Uma2 family endonuclease [Desulfobacteraceae bacterium]